MEKLLSPEQAAEALGFIPETIRQWIRQKKIKAIKIGRKWRIKESDLQAFLEGPKKKKI